MAEQKTKWKNRIIGSGVEKLDAILFNPKNWRIHSMIQQEATSKILSRIGWVQQVIINRTTGNLIDGHMRCQIAERNGETEIPVIYVDLSEAEEALMLAALDSSGAMAGIDKDKYIELAKELKDSFDKSVLDSLNNISSFGLHLDLQPHFEVSFMDDVLAESKRQVEYVDVEKDNRINVKQDNGQFEGEEIDMYYPSSILLVKLEISMQKAEKDEIYKVLTKLMDEKGLTVTQALLEVCRAYGN